MNIDEYEKECERIREENSKLLDVFSEDLQGLSPKTIIRHITNVDFYINDYLLRYDAETFEMGLTSMGSFLGDYFIRKCMWSTPSSIGSTATSIKKFYKSMADHNKITMDEYKVFAAEIKEGLPEWKERCELYNSGGFSFFDLYE